MALFYVDDDDRPMYVEARDFCMAQKRWEEKIKEENDGDSGDPPKGISYLCGDDDFLLLPRYPTPF